MADLKVKILMEAAERVSAPLKRATQSTEKMREAMKAAADGVRKLEQAQANVQAFARLKREAQGNAAALAAAQEKAKGMALALAEADGGTKKAQAAFARARKEVDRLRAAQEANARDTATMRARLAEAGVSTRTLSADQRRLRRDLDAAREAANRQAKAMEASAAKAKAMAAARGKLDGIRNMQGSLAIGGAAGMAAGGGALAVGSRMAGAGISFEQQMSRVGAVARLDKQSDDFKALVAQAKELGAATSFSASEAAEGMQYLSMAGFNAQQMLASMPGMLDLAKAGAVDLGTAADIASNVLSGFGMEAGEMTRLGDVMVATFTRSNVDLQMLGNTMKYTAPIARQFGASVEDVAAMSGLLGNIGIQGEMAGTAMRALFTRLAAPPKMARDALTDLGIATQTAEGNMRPIVDILAEVAKKSENLGDAKRLEYFTAIAGMEAGSAMSELVGKGGTGEITKFVEILKAAQGESAQVAKAMGDNIAGDIDEFTSVVEGLNIALTETNNAPLRALIQDAAGVVRGIQGWVEANPALAGTLLKVAAATAGLVFVGGVLATIIAGLLGPFAMARFALSAIGIHAGFAGGAMKLLVGGFGLAAKGGAVLFPLLATGIKTVGLAFAANPIGLAVVAIGAAAALVIAYWEPISEFFANLWSGIGEAFDGAWATILAGIERIRAPLTWVSEMWGKLFGEDGPGDMPAPEAPAGREAPIKIAPPPSAGAQAVAASRGGAAAMVAPVDMGGVSITVHAAPGMDAAEVARMVKAEMEKWAAKGRTAARARMYDEED